MSIPMPVFDTLKYVEELQAAGVSEVQAKAHARAAAVAFDTHEDRLATKEDLRLLGTELHSEMGQLRTELRGEMGQLRTELRGEIEQIRNTMRWIAGPSLLGTMATALGMAVLLAKNFS